MIKCAFHTPRRLQKDSHAARKHLLFTLSNWDTSPPVNAPVPAAPAAVQTERVPLPFPLVSNAKIMKPSYGAQLSVFVFISRTFTLFCCMLRARLDAKAEERTRPLRTGLLARLFLCAKIGFSFSRQQ